MSLYSVRYANRSITTVLDNDGRVVSETETLVEQVHHALPYQCALRYSHLPEFSIVPYAIDQQPARAESKRKTRETVTEIVRSVTTTTRTTLNHAASTGDLSAALNS